jgi:hypothetical protein
MNIDPESLKLFLNTLEEERIRTLFILERDGPGGLLKWVKGVMACYRRASISPPWNRTKYKKRFIRSYIELKKVYFRLNGLVMLQNTI